MFTQKERDQLEMMVLVRSLQSYSPRPNELGFAPRLSATLERLGKANPELVNVTNSLIVHLRFCIVHVFPSKGSINFPFVIF